MRRGSSAVGGSFARLAGLLGDSQAARSVFNLAIHVTFVVMYAVWLNWNHVVLGTGETGLPGRVIAAAGVAGLTLVVWLTRRLRLVRPG